jgi:hypothetical protein
VKLDNYVFNIWKIKLLLLDISIYIQNVLGGWHQFAVYNELVKDYFCSDGKDIYTSVIYSDDDPYANRELRLYASVFLPPH